MRILTKEDQEKQYAKYYALSLFPPPHQLKADIESRKIDPEYMVPLERREIVLDAHVEKEYIGYGYLEDRFGYVSTVTYMPNVTPEMIDWWFVWLNHPDPSVPAEYGNLKYKIWCPPDHWDHHFLDEDDPDAGMRICESLDLGQGAPRKNIINKSLPIELLGIDPAILASVKNRGISLKFGAGCDENGVPGGVGINMFIPAEGGAVWTSRGWGGITPRNGRLEVTGNGSPDEKDVQCELTHNVLERRHLGEILPGLYREYGGQ